LTDPVQIENKFKAMAAEAELLGKAKQAATGLDYLRKSKRSELMRTQSGSVAERENYALTQPEYIDLCNQHAEAEGDYIRLKARHDIGLAWISFQQTLFRLERA